MEEVITFDKDCDERLENYTSVLGSSQMSVSQIKEKWAFYIELTVDQSGWQAIWKVPRFACERFGIRFPTLVLVGVEDIKPSELCAIAKILAVQDDDVHLSETHLVPLSQLWPTKQQDPAATLTIHSTAETVDMLRFFYNHVVMPWDHLEDETGDWLNQHLKSRMTLFYDMNHGNVPNNTSEHIRDIVSEARRLQAKLEFDSELEEDTLVDMHLHLTEIRNEFELLENPLLRESIIRKQNRAVSSCPSSKYWAVLEHEELDDCLSFLSNLKLYAPDEDISYAPTLEFLLENASSFTTVLLSPSRHVIDCEGVLRMGGVVFKGLRHKTDTILTTSKTESVMLEFNGDVSLDNLTIDAGQSQGGILVQQGANVTLNNCKVASTEVRRLCQGITILSGGVLSLIDCDITGFAIGIVAHAGCTVTLKNCRISGVDIGIKLYEKCAFRATACALRNCREYGFCMETQTTSSGDRDSSVLGSLLDLQSKQDIIVEEVICDSNAKGDVVFNNVPKLNLLQEYSSNA